MLRKLILLTLASGLAKKGYDLYKAREANETPTPTPAARAKRVARRSKVSPAATHQRATTVGESS